MIAKTTTHSWLFMAAIGLSVLFFVGCNSQSEVQPALSYPDPPKKEKSAEDSVMEVRINSLVDTVYQIKIDKTRKCNLTEGYYVLKNNKIDSADLLLITKHLASQLYINTKLDKACDYKKMTSATIYLDMQDYRDDQGNYISMCNIDPDHPEGDTFIMPHKLKKLKQSDK